MNALVRSFTSVCLAMIAAALASAAEQVSSLRVDLPYQAERSEPIAHEVDFSIVVTPPYHCHVLKVWVPLPPSDSAQTISGSRFSTRPMECEPQIASEPVYGNRFAYFEFHEPHGAQIIRHQFSAKVWQLDWNVTPDKVTNVDRWPASFEPYLQPQSLDDEKQFRKLLSEIVPRPEGGASDLAKLMGWIDANLTYDHVTASLKADANHALTERRGHCSDYHGLCATMGRAMGCPTRVTYGLSLFPKNSPSHCKMEAFLPPYGWVSYDVSETQRFVADIYKNTKLSDDEKEQIAKSARARLQRGFRENSWLLLTRGTDYQLAPPAAQPVRVVRTAYVEADGEALPDPDPANGKKREFAWMTVHDYQADRPFKQPFKDLSTLVE
jgi:transglutaminase-like putative cysteine protease